MLQLFSLLQEVDRLQQRLAEMQTRETANGNLQNKVKVGSIFRSTSKSKVIKVSQNNIPHPPVCVRGCRGQEVLSWCCLAWTGLDTNRGSGNNESLGL